MLRRVSKILGVLAVLLVSAFVFNKVTAVTLDDVAHHFSLGRPQATLGVSGGDIYAISPDGLSERKLCALRLQSDFVKRVQVRAQFSNDIGTTLPALVDWISFGTAEGSSAPEDVDGARLRFVGDFTELAPEAPLGTSVQCERRMAELMNRRHRICMVRASLIPSDNAVFSAYKFDRRQIFLPDAVFEQHGMDKSDAVREVQAKPCPSGSNPAWDVRVRHLLRIVSMQPLRADPVS